MPSGLLAPTGRDKDFSTVYLDKAMHGWRGLPRAPVADIGEARAEYWLLYSWRLEIRCLLISAFQICKMWG